MVIGTGYTDRFLTEEEARQVLQQGVAQLDVAGKKVLVIIPDSTRSGPISLCFRALVEYLSPSVAQLDFLIALGTHRPMTEEQLCKHVGITMAERHSTYAKIGLYNHDWQQGLKHIGTISAAEIRELSNGLMELDLPVRINGRIFAYDHLIICGPVFPHEVVGFSGGNKYFFPGIAGGEVIDITHWLIPLPKSCFSMVVKGHHDLAGLYFGTPEESQEAAAALSAQVNIVYVDQPFKLVISVMPELYDDLWTAAKGVYKMEPVVADGGTVIVYAPHIDEVSYTHGHILDRIGYHVRDYFLKNWERFKDVPWGVLAHSTHCKGSGTYENGVEKPRMNVILSTGIPKERCERINLGYLDPATLNLDAYKGREAEGILVVPRAGEMLYRLREQ